MNPFASARKQAGLVQEEAASILGVDRSTIAKWETGESKPRAGLLPLVARTYNCKIDELLNDSDITEAEAT